MIDAETWSALRGISPATSRAQLGQYLQHAQLFAVHEDNEDRYPGFQFDADGVPLPEIATILQVVPEGVRGWPVLSWFVSSNVLLEGCKPIDVLRDNALVVRDAARAFSRDEALRCARPP
jgi:hypothetical protein